MIRQSIILALLLLTVPLLAQAGPPPPDWIKTCEGYGFVASVIALDRDRGTPRAQMLEWVRGWFTSAPADRLGIRMYSELAHAVYDLPHTAPAAMQDAAEALCRTEGLLPESGVR